MIIEPLAFPYVILLRPKRYGDARGWFSETYSARTLADAGIGMAFVQDNQSFSAQQGTLRGMHWQNPPFAQAKLVRVLRGAILDVAVDIRKGSPTYGHHVTARLDARDGTQILVPEGFAHGILTLEPDTELLYKVSAFYSPAHDRGCRWNDPSLAITWPLPETDLVLSDKDRAQPLLADADNPFHTRAAA